MPLTGPSRDIPRRTGHRKTRQPHQSAERRPAHSVHARRRDLYHLPSRHTHRKVHHLLYAATFDTADRISATLAWIGNLAADDRPILGPDSRDLLEIVLESAGSYLGSRARVDTVVRRTRIKSGFDTLAECCADLAAHVFVIETRPASDPTYELDVLCTRLLSACEQLRRALAANAGACGNPTTGRMWPTRHQAHPGMTVWGTVEFFPVKARITRTGTASVACGWPPGQARARRRR